MISRGPRASVNNPIGMPIAYMPRFPAAPCQAVNIGVSPVWGHTTHDQISLGRRELHAMCKLGCPCRVCILWKYRLLAIGRRTRIGIAKSGLGITNISSAGQSYQSACDDRNSPGSAMIRAGHVCAILAGVFVHATERDAIASRRVIGGKDRGFRNLDTEEENEGATRGGTSDSNKRGTRRGQQRTRK